MGHLARQLGHLGAGLPAALMGILRPPFVELHAHSAQARKKKHVSKPEVCCRLDAMITQYTRLFTEYTELFTEPLPPTAFFSNHLPVSPPLPPPAAANGKPLDCNTADCQPSACHPTCFACCWGKSSNQRCLIMQAWAAADAAARRAPSLIISTMTRPPSLVRVCTPATPAMRQASPD